MGPRGDRGGRPTKGATRGHTGHRGAVQRRPLRQERPHACLIGHVAHQGSFEEGHETLLELADIDVPTKQVEREAERLGKEIAEDEKRVVEPVSQVELPPTLYLGLDGTGIPMRKSELVGRTGKQEDGSAKTREVKLCTVWSAEGRDDEGVPIREATRRGFANAVRHVVLGDGAEWIWNIATEQFSDAIQIVDRYHANEHLCDAAKAIYGAGSDLVKQWAHSRCTNRARMRYAEFHAAGLCTSTAVVESGCKRAIGLRLKRGGMFWTVKGADAIIALRCCKLSGRFEDFWERRSVASR